MSHPLPDRRPDVAPVHYPVPLPTEQPHAAPLVPRADASPAVAEVLLPDGRVVTGYALTPAQPQAPAPAAPASPLAKNLALSGLGIAAVCGGLVLLTGFITALAQLVWNLVILAAVLLGIYAAVQIFGGSGGGTTVNARKAVFKNNRFYG